MERCHLYFVKRFGGKQLSTNLDILNFKSGFDPVSQIQQCDREWKNVGYYDERVWTHMFLNTLYDIPHKWYTIEEESIHTFD